MTQVSPPKPPLTGTRVALRPFTVGDAPAIAAAVLESDIPRFTMTPDAMTEAEACDWIERGLEWWPRGVARFAITRPTDDRCVGQIGVQIDVPMRRAETFYWLTGAARGQGLASQALELVTQWVFRDFDIARLQLATHVDNEASQRLAERCGFTREGILRAWEPVKGEQPDVVMFSRLAGDPPPHQSHH